MYRFPLGHNLNLCCFSRCLTTSPLWHCFPQCCPCSTVQYSTVQYRLLDSSSQPCTGCSLPLCGSQCQGGNYHRWDIHKSLLLFPLLVPFCSLLPLWLLIYSNFDIFNFLLLFFFFSFFSPPSLCCTSIVSKNIPFGLQSNFSLGFLY